MNETSERVGFTDIYMDEDMMDAAVEVLRSGRYVKGPQVETFEEEFAEKCGVEHAVGVNSGTSAILLALKSMGVESDDEVFVPGNTYFASVSPVLSLGADPVFVDVQEDSYTIDVDDLEAKVEQSEDPEAVIPVHIYGQMAEMERVSEVAEKHGLSVVSDSCQAHFAERDGAKAGTVADAGCFSFYPSKNMTVAGDGGMLVTDEDQIAELARAYRNHGRDEEGVHRYLGLNHRLSEVLAAVGRKQLEKIDDWNAGRRQAADIYGNRLENVEEVTVPAEDGANRHVYHLYVIQASNREGLMEHLDTGGVDTGVHYETPAHEHSAVVERCGETTLEFTEQLYDRIVSLPMHPRLAEEEVHRVCDLIEEYYE